MYPPPLLLLQRSEEENETRALVIKASAGPLVSGVRVEGYSFGFSQFSLDLVQL
jgi:hypothetical protein